MWPYRLAQGTVAATFILLIAGGLVHATDSGLACPDWPTCYGSFMPAMTGGILFEHSHRLIATAVGCLTLILAVVVHRAHPGRRGVARMAWAALALVIVQGLLGGLTVILKLPTLVSSAHLATSMAFFVLLITLTHALRPGAASPIAPGAAAGQAPRWVLVAALATYLQICLGAAVRHTDAGLACADLPLCAGVPWFLGADPRVGLHMAHRLGALVVAAAVLAAAARVLRSGAADGPTRALACALGGLVAVQIGLGLLSIHTALEVVTVTAHLAAGALLLGGSVALWLRLSPATAA